MRRGKTWNESLAGYHVMTLSADGFRIWASTCGTVFKSENAGISWTAYKTPVSSVNGQFGLHANGETIFVSNGDAGLAISDDGANSWRVLEKGTVFESAKVQGIGGTGANIYVAAVANGRNILAVSYNNGLTWRSQVLQPDAEPAGNSPRTDGDYVYVVTHGAGLGISTDKANTWMMKTTADGLATNYLHDVAATGENIFIATDSGLSVSHDGGKTFASKSTGLSGGLYSAYVQCLD